MKQNEIWNTNTIYLNKNYMDVKQFILFPEQIQTQRYTLGVLE